ncbi:MAG: hypothetical protein ACT4OM_06550 [Actinomycetota bacterium]
MSPQLSPVHSSNSDLAQSWALGRLNRRIALVAGFIAAELWMLESALDAWVHGRSLTLILTFQLAAFAGSVATLFTAPRPARAAALLARPELLR